MAIIAAIKARTQSKTAMRKVIEYVSQDKKTQFKDPETGQRYRLITGQNCVAETAYREFMATKIQHGKDHGVFYKQFVQSFKPGIEVTPQEIHQMGLELAQYFKGFEVLVATHIDEDHWHNHLIINSVNAETGLKIQFNERNLNQLRQYSDEICRAHGLETLKPSQKGRPGINTREFRAAAKGQSWKFQLMNAIDAAMAASRDKRGFIAGMERMGYSVKWAEHHKYITYTTPDGKRCRDNRLHDEKYLKGNMENELKFRNLERTEPEQHRASAETIPTAGIRSPTGTMGGDFVPAPRKSDTAARPSTVGNDVTDNGQPEQCHGKDTARYGSIGRRLEKGNLRPGRTGWENTRNAGTAGESTNECYCAPVQANAILPAESRYNSGRVAGIASDNIDLLNRSRPKIEQEQQGRKKRQRRRGYDRGMEL